MRFALHILTLLTATAVLGGCAQTIAAPRPSPVEAWATPEPVLPTNVTDPVEGSDALWIPDRGGSLLGEGVASLGNVARPGAWVRAGFLPENGADVEIEADTPHGTVRIRVSGVIEEGPVQLSLAAYQALGLSPTALPVLRVFSTEAVPDAG